jgi:hypothetical protein
VPAYFTRPDRLFGLKLWPAFRAAVASRHSVGSKICPESMAPMPWPIEWGTVIDREHMPTLPQASVALTVIA